MATVFQQKQSWADDDEVLPAPETTQNEDGTKTVVSYKLNDDGKKVKLTQRIKTVTTREKVDHNVAERKKWAKFGLEKGHAEGPSSITTSVEPDMPFKLSVASQTKKVEPEPVAEPAADAKISCRICSGVHFTSKCPYKDTLGVPEEDKAAAAAAGGEAPSAAAVAAGGAAKPGRYVPPQLRAGATPRPSQREQEENTTLRVSNLSEDVFEEDLRELFSRFGRVMRCHVVKDRETQRPRGFAFVSFDMPSAAEKACAKMNGVGLDNLIMRVEFSKK